MLLLSACFLWLYFASSVAASFYAAPFEALTFYKAYLIEWYGNGGKGTTVIGSNCVSATAGGPCDINEFIKKVYHGNHPSVNIDGKSMEDAYKALLMTGNMANAKYNAKELSGSTGYSTYRQDVYRVMNAVQDAKRKNVNTEKVSSLMSDLDVCLNGVLQERNADQYDGLFRDFKSRWAAKFDIKDMKAVVPAKTTLSGRTWDKPDYARAIADYKTKATPAQRRKLLKDLGDDEKAYFNDKRTQGGKHKAAMVAVKTVRNTFTNPDKNSCNFPTS